VNKEAYTPEVVSIGPFHHGDKRLETMEKLKVRYFKRFVQKAALNLEKLVSTIRDRERDVRRCYVETIQISSDDCVKMIMVDASFIIMFFLTQKHEEWRGEDDLIVFTTRLIAGIRKDIRLLENQLPFFIIEELYNFAFASRSNFPSFTQLAFGFLARFNSRPISLDPDLKIKHFVDLLRTTFLPQSISHRLPSRNHGEKIKHLHTASQLHEAGVKFKVNSSSKCLFDFRNGVLEIPYFKLNNYTESLYRNLMALEQCHYPLDAYFTDYIHVLDMLINTTKDVDLFVRKKIFANGLGNTTAVTNLVNNFCKHIFISNTNSDYYCLCKDLNSFYVDPWHRRKVILRRDYFSNPWRTIATIAATILLVLTLIQTVRSFY
jgi:hypothetical protein